MSKDFFIKSEYADTWTEKVRRTGTLSTYELEFIRLIDVQDGEYLLEIGSGEGRIAKGLLKSNIFYIGIDLSSQILTYARTELMQHFNTRYYLIAADSAHIPLKPSVQKVFAINTIFFCPDRYNTLRNSRSILRDHGKLIIDNNNMLNLYYIGYYLYGKIRYLIKKIANKFRLIRKIIKTIRKRDYNPYFRPGSKGNIIIYHRELKILNFKNIKYSPTLTIFQQYFLRLIPNFYIRQLLREKILKYFAARLIIEAKLE
ncbi:MAG: class I SAM-dependent methyltransferase [Candidatus Helarchaeota archaeon]